MAAADILSTERAGIANQIQELMTDRLDPRSVEVTDFFVRQVVPPDAIRGAIEEKLAREQQVQAEQFRTQVGWSRPTRNGPRRRESVMPGR